MKGTVAFDGFTEASLALLMCFHEIESDDLSRTRHVSYTWRAVEFVVR